jgi:hypothetical protein
VKYYNFVRNKRAENVILSTLHLDRNSFIAKQRQMSDKLVNDLARELLNYEIPDVSAIFGGVDTYGAHIYVVRNNEATCADVVGFAAIGIGSRHASSQFMFAGHAWNSPFPDTLLLTHFSKKKAEAAPGVGKGTDMVMVGPTLGSFITIGEPVLNKLDAAYQEIMRSEDTAFARARGEIRTYVEELTKQGEATAATAAASPDKQASPKTTNGTASVDEPKI